jgi:cobalamin biosynthesis protein CobD/CbiB
LLAAVAKALLIAVFVAQRGLYEHVAAVAAALDTGGLAAHPMLQAEVSGADSVRLVGCDC